MLAGEEGESVGLLLKLSLAVQDAMLSERQVMFAPFMPAHPPGDQQVITDCMLLLSTYAQGTVRVQFDVFVKWNGTLVAPPPPTRNSCKYFHIRALVPYMVHVMTKLEAC